MKKPSSKWVHEQYDEINKELFKDYKRTCRFESNILKFGFLKTYRKALLSLRGHKIEIIQIAFIIHFELFELSKYS